MLLQYLQKDAAIASDSLIQLMDSKQSGEHGKQQHWEINSTAVSCRLFQTTAFLHISPFKPTGFGGKHLQLFMLLHKRIIPFTVDLKFSEKNK